MSDHKLDRLFREKAELYQPSPGSDAWAQINAQIHPRRRLLIVYHWAAAIAVFLVASILVIFSLQLPERTTMAGIVVNQPTPAPELAIVIPASKEKYIENKGNVSGSVSDDIQENLPADLGYIENAPVTKVNVALCSVEKKERNMLINVPVGRFSVELFEAGKSKIKIEYYADATVDDVAASKGRIGKLLEKAKSTSPADLLADIRDAKDNFINSALNLD